MPLARNLKKFLVKHVIFIKYVGVQFAIYAMDLLIYTGALMFLSPSLSQAFSKFLCGIFSFIAQKVYVFNSPKERQNIKALKYFLLWLVNIPFTACLVGLLYSATNEKYLSKIIIDIAAFIANYIIVKTFIFGTDRS